MEELERAKASLSRAIQNLDTPKPAYVLDTEWLNQFDAEGLSHLAADLENAPLNEVAQIIHRWYATAETLKNPGARQVLLTPQKSKDYEALLWPTSGNLPKRTPMIDP
jgi:hypothetical protein